MKETAKKWRGRDGQPGQEDVVLSEESSRRKVGAAQSCRWKITAVDAQGLQEDGREVELCG